MTKLQSGSSLVNMDLRGPLNTELQVAFLSLWVVNALGLLLLSFVFKGNIVLGNDKVPPALAAIISGFILNLVAFLTQPIAKKLGISVKNQNALSAIYFGSSFLSIWVIKRLASLTGLGISNLLYVLIAAVVVTIAFKVVVRLVSLFLKKI